MYDLYSDEGALASDVNFLSVASGDNLFCDEAAVGDGVFGG